MATARSTELYFTKRRIEMSQKRICEICGSVQDVNDMHEVFTGRKYWICIKCYRAGDKDVKTRLSRHKAHKQRGVN